MATVRNAGFAKRLEPSALIGRFVSFMATSVSSTRRPVLLIDDNHEDLFLIKRLLARAGVKGPIVTIDDGEEAKIFLRASLNAGAAELMPRCVFCDVKMPNVDGFELLKWMRVQKPLAKIVFCLLHGSDAPTDQEKALKLGADHCFAKFPSADVLGKVVDQAGG